MLSCCSCRVTNCPQIHSGGFHFAFNLQQHPEMGYVLPTWVGDKQLQPTLLESLDSSVLTRLLQQQRALREQQQGILEQPQQQDSSDHEQLGEHATVPSDDAASTATRAEGVETSAGRLQAGGAASLPAGVALSQLLGPSNMTLLHLPLKPGSEDVGQKLAQLRPTLLLFLRQLRCLVLSDAEAGTVRNQLPQHRGVVAEHDRAGVVAGSSSSQLLRLSAIGLVLTHGVMLSDLRSTPAADLSSLMQITVEYWTHFLYPLPCVHAEQGDAAY